MPPPISGGGIIMFSKKDTSSDYIFVWIERKKYLKPDWLPNLGLMQERVYKSAIHDTRDLKQHCIDIQANISN